MRGVNLYGVGGCMQEIYVCMGLKGARRGHMFVWGWRVYVEDVCIRFVDASKRYTVCGGRVHRSYARMDRCTQQMHCIE